MFEGMEEPPSPPQPAETRARTPVRLTASKIVSVLRVDSGDVMEDKGFCVPVIVCGSSTTTDPKLGEEWN